MASERGLSGLSWPPSPSERVSAVGVRASAAVRLSAPCQTRHWMMMTTMITIACSPAHREAAMRGRPPPLHAAAAAAAAEEKSPAPSLSERPAPPPLPAAESARAGPTSQRRRQWRRRRRRQWQSFRPSLLPSSRRQSLEPFPGRSSSTAAPLTVFSSLPVAPLLTIYT